MTVENKSFLPVSFEVKEMDQATGEFEGLGAVYKNIDLGLDVIEKGAFDQVIEEMKAEDRMPGLYWQHRSDTPIGDYIDMKSTAQGLLVKGVLWVEGNKLGRKPIEQSEIARNQLMSRGPKGLSIGYIVGEHSYEKRKFKVPYGPNKGSSIDVETRIIKTISALDEVSIVSNPMNPKARISGVKSLIEEDQEIDIYNVRDLEGVLRDIGFSKSEAKALIAKGYSGLRRDDEVTESRDDSISDQEVKALKDLLQTWDI